MVEPPVNRLPYLVEGAEVDEPARVRVHGAEGGDLDFERMPVESRTFVPFGNPGEPVRSLEPELVNEPNRMRIDPGPILRRLVSVRNGLRDCVA